MHLKRYPKRPRHEEISSAWRFKLGKYKGYAAALMPKTKLFREGLPRRRNSSGSLAIFAAIRHRRDGR